MIEQVIDFRRSIPPYPPVLSDALADTLHGIAADAPTMPLLQNGVAGGSDRDRAAAAKWLAPRFGHDIAPERLLVTNGTQSALQLLLEHHVGAGGVLLAEQLSYGVLRPLAARAHVELIGVALDEEGLIPESLETECRRHRPKALYCNPTVHNPTAAIMSEPRRLAIAEIARRHGLVIIEDDPLGRLHPGAPRPIAALAPDVTWYIMGLTKCLAHGLRIAYLAAPTAADRRALLEPVSRLSHWFPAPLSAGVATSWIETGAAETISAAIRTESELRRALAAETLGPAQVAGPAGSLHIWLALPTQIHRDDLTAALAQRNVLVRPSDLFAVDDSPAPNAIRISLSSPPTREHVRLGLAALADELRFRSPDERWG